METFRHLNIVEKAVVTLARKERIGNEINVIIFSLTQIKTVILNSTKGSLCPLTIKVQRVSLYTQLMRKEITGQQM